MNLTVAKGIETNLHLLLAEKKLSALRVTKEAEQVVVEHTAIDPSATLEMGEAVDPKEQEKQLKEQKQMQMATDIFELGIEGIDDLLEQFRMPRSNNITESIEELVNSQSPELLQGAIDSLRTEQGGDGGFHRASVV